MLTLYRRHSKPDANGQDGCPYADNPYWKKCKCPMWVRGSVEGRPIKESLKTRSWERAEHLKKALEDPAITHVIRPALLPDACDRFLADCRSRLSADPIRKYTLFVKQLKDYASEHGVCEVRELTFEKLVDFRAKWTEQAGSTRLKKLERMRAVMKFFHDAGYISTNPAKAIKPGNPGTSKVDPFTDKEQATILSKQCLPRTRAFINVLYFGALRMSDAVMLRPEHLDGNAIRFVATKRIHGGQKTVRIPIPPDLVKLLNSLPLNRGYFFLQGSSEHHPTQSDYWRGVLKEHFGKSIPKFHPHRFRHSAAVRWLTQNPPLTIEEVAALLGNSVKVVEKHYATWCGARQQRLEEKLAQGFKQPAKLVRVK